MHINIMNSFFNEFLIISNPNPKSQSSSSDAMHHGDLLLLYPDRNHKQVKRNNSSTGIYRPLSVESLESVLTDPVAYSFCSLFMLPSEPALRMKIKIRQEKTSEEKLLVLSRSSLGLIVLFLEGKN